MSMDLAAGASPPARGRYYSALDFCWRPVHESAWFVQHIFHFLFENIALFFATPSFFGGAAQNLSMLTGRLQRLLAGGAKSSYLPTINLWVVRFARYRMSPSISVFSFSPINQEKASGVLYWWTGRFYFFTSEWKQQSSRLLGQTTNL